MQSVENICLSALQTNNCTEHHKDSALRIRGYSSIKKGSEDDLLNAVITVGESIFMFLSDQW